jgi:hypothetical protein
MKVVINRCFGGYGLSHEGMMAYAKLKGIVLFGYVHDMANWQKTQKDRYTPYKPGERAYLIHYCTRQLQNEFDKKTLNEYYFTDDKIERNDPLLIQVVERLGDKANGDCAELEIVEIPDGTDYTIEEYDGNEHIAERHQTWP